MTPSLPRGDPWPVLAGLRFFFAAWVLFDHTYNFGPVERAMPVFTRSGLVPVLCFFVISGFSIHHSIASNPVGYGARRFWRIAPIQVLAVAIAWTAYIGLGLRGGYGTPPTPPGPWTWIGSLLLLQCLLPVKIPLLAPAWSLSIEVLYYLVAPVLRRVRHGVIAVIAAVSCLLFAAWPLLNPRYIGDASYGLAAAALAWAWLAGWVARSHPANPVWFGLFLVAGYAGIAAEAKVFAVADYLAWTATMVAVSSRIGLRGNAVAARWLNYLGELSYPLYLLHYPVLFTLTSSVLAVHPEWNYGVVQVAVALACAVAAYHWVDRPLRYRSRPIPREQPLTLAVSR